MNSVPAAVIRRIRPDVQAMQAYVVQDAQGLIKLDAMENPYLLPAELRRQLGQRLGTVALNRYPGARIAELKRLLAAHAGLHEGHDLMLGNGSDELISLLALACAQPSQVMGKPARACVLAPEPGFVMYAMSAKLQGLDYVGVPLLPDFALDLTAMRAAIAQHRPALTYLAYPNNPTANLWNDDAMQAVIDAVANVEGLVVIDEAYQPFAARSYASGLAQFDHVLLLRTLSKFGLAGVRLGYLIGPEPLIAQIDKVRPPYNISVLNCEAAMFALENQEIFAAQAQQIRAQRALLLGALGQLPQVRAFPSEANMVLLRVPNAQHTFESMKAHGVLIKNVSKMHPLLDQCLRLTVGTESENRQMLAALKASL